MEKIDFVNNTTPALNATNLNKLQQNVEDVTGDLEDLETSARTNLVDAINEAKEIVDSGSNTNGLWVKYSNGTMISYGRKEGTSSLSNYWGQFERTQTISQTFPVEYYEKPYLMITNNNRWSGEVSVIVEELSKTAFGFQVLKCDGATGTNYSIDWMAIGRWK